MINKEAIDFNIRIEEVSIRDRRADTLTSEAYSRYGIDAVLNDYILRTIIDRMRQHAQEITGGIDADMVKASENIGKMLTAQFPRMISEDEPDKYVMHALNAGLLFNMITNIGEACQRKQSLYVRYGLADCPATLS